MTLSDGKLNCYYVTIVHQQYKCIVFEDCMYVAMYVAMYGCKNSEIILSKHIFGTLYIHRLAFQGIELSHKATFDFNFLLIIHWMVFPL